MTLEQRIAKQWLDDLIPRYMQAGLFDGKPDAIFRQTLLCDVIQLVKMAREVRAEDAADHERLIPTPDDCKAFMTNQPAEYTLHHPKPEPTPAPKKRATRRRKAPTK